MNAVELFNKSLGKWEGRRWYVYDSGEKIVRYTQFENVITDQKDFLFNDGISVHHTFKVWNVTSCELVLDGVSSATIQRVSDIRHQTSDIRHQTSDIRDRVRNLRHLLLEHEMETV